MHVPLFSQLFGPTRLWWCFPYEWLISQIQCLLSNHKIGQMESTLLLSFLTATKLHCWLSDPQSPFIFKEIKLVFDNIYKSNNLYDDPHHDSSTDQANLDVSTPKSIPDDLKNIQIINKNKVFIRAHIKLQGISYTHSQTHLGNSLVHLHPEGDQRYLGKSNIYILPMVFFMPLHSSSISTSLLIHLIQSHNTYIFLSKCTPPNTLHHLNMLILTGSFAIMHNGISHPIICCHTIALPLNLSLLNMATAYQKSYVSYLKHDRYQC